MKFTLLFAYFFAIALICETESSSWSDFVKNFLARRTKTFINRFNRNVTVSPLAAIRDFIAARLFSRGELGRDEPFPLEEIVFWRRVRDFFFFFFFKNYAMSLSILIFLLEQK